MPNIANVLKDEIARVARKELRAEIAGMKKASAAQRAEIAALKRRTLELEQALRRLGKTKVKPMRPAGAEASAKADAEAADTVPSTLRFSAKGLVSQRKRLGLSASDCGLLVGASGQSIYNWEAQAARPRGVHLPAIAALRVMGKKEAAARLEALKAAA